MDTRQFRIHVTLEDLLEVFGILTGCHETRCHIGGIHINAVDPEFHDILFGIGKLGKIVLVEHHFRVERHAGFILRDDGEVWQTGNGELAVGPVLQILTAVHIFVHALGGKRVESVLIAGLEAEEALNPEILQHVQDGNHGFHSIHMGVNLRLVPQEALTGQLAPRGDGHGHRREDGVPDRMAEVIFVIDRIEVCDQSRQIRGLGHHLIAHVGDEQTRTHPPELGGILLEEQAHAQDLLDEGFHRLDEVILRILIELKVLVVVLDFLRNVDIRDHRGGQRAEGAHHQRFHIVIVIILVEGLVVFADDLDESLIHLVVQGDKSGALLFLRSFDDLELTVLAHGEHTESQRGIPFAAAAGGQKQTGLDILDGKGQHGHDVVVVDAGLFHHHIELIAEIQLLRILVVELHILGIDIAEFLAVLLDVFHDLLRRNELRQVLELKVHIKHTLRAFRIHQCQEHAQKIIVIVQVNLRQKIIRNALGLFQRIYDLLVVRIVEGIHHRIEFFDEFAEAPHRKRVQNLPDLLIGKAVL